jgi:shikimate kinase
MTFFLVGMPGSGKTTFGRAFAAHHNLAFLDLDAEIERFQGSTIAGIFTAKGEAEFRKIERDTLQNLDFSLPIVVATGGGTPCFLDNMTFMRKHGTVLWLDAELPILQQRLGKNSAQRPLFQHLDSSELAQKIADLYENRKAFYAQAHYRCT